MNNSLTPEYSNHKDDSRHKEQIIESSLNLFDVGSLFLARRRMIMTVLGVVAVITIISLLLIPNTYQSTATILPSGGVDKMAGLKSLAGMGGLISSDENSSELFPAILRSRLIREALLERTFSFTFDAIDQTTTLAEYFGEEDHDRLLAALELITIIDVNQKNGIIVVGAETKYPEFSQSITTAYLEELESFNMHKRRSQAGERAVYLKRELAKIKVELTQHEDSLEYFQSHNREWALTSNPEILKALLRYKRDIEISSVAFGFLRKEYEIARLDAQKDIQIVRVLDQPSLPTLKVGPLRTLTLILVSLVAMMLLAGWILLGEFFKQRIKGPEMEAYSSFQSSLSKAFPVITRLINKK